MSTTEGDKIAKQKTIQFVIEMVIINVIGFILIIRMGSPSGIIIGIMGICISVILLLRLFHHVDSLVTQRLEMYDP